MLKEQLDCLKKCDVRSSKLHDGERTKYVEIAPVYCYLKKNSRMISYPNYFDHAFDYVSKAEKLASIYFYS